MDDRKLHVLLTAQRLGSFGKAALELNCSQPAVTQMINSIENELGCKIFCRGHNGIQLTPAGEALLPFLTETDACYTRLAEEARSIAQGITVPVRIAAFACIASNWLPDAIKAYQEQHPNVAFDIRITTKEIPEWLRSGEIDIAMADEVRCEGFRWYPLIDDPYMAVLPRTMARDCTQVIQQEVLSSFPFITAPMEDVERQLFPRPAKRMTVNSDDNNALISMVAQGLGATVLPKLSLQNLPDGVRTLELEPPIKRTLGIGLSNEPRKGAKDFASFLRKRYPY